MEHGGDIVTNEELADIESDTRCDSWTEANERCLALIAEVHRLRERVGALENVADEMLHVLRDHNGEANPAWLDSLGVVLLT